MSDPNQPRHSDGTFANKPYVDAGQIDLTQGIDLWERTGTFEFPPQCNGVREIVAFWSQVEVPDDVLQSFTAAYDRRARREEFNHINHWSLVNLPLEKWKGTAAQRDALCQQELDRWIAERDKTMPHQVRPTWTRAIVRIGKMVQAVQAFPQEHQQLLYNLQVTMPGGWKHTIGSIYTMYRLGGLLDDMKNVKRVADVNEAFDILKGN